MYEIHKFTFIKVFIKVGFQCCQRIPSDMRHFVFVPRRMKFQNRSVKHSETIRAALFRLFAEQLHTNTDAEYRLTKIANHLVEFVLPQVLHSRRRFALTGENNPVGSCQHLGIGRDNRLYTKPFQAVIDRIDVACVIFYYCY